MARSGTTEYQTIPATATPLCIIYFLRVPCAKEGPSQGTNRIALKETLFIDLVCLLDGKLIARIAVIRILGSEPSSTQSEEGTLTIAIKVSRRNTLNDGCPALGLHRHFGT